MHKIGILYIIDSLGLGGAERQLVELLKGINSKNYNTHLLVLGWKTDSYEEIVSHLNVTIHSIPRRYRYDIIEPVLRIANYINRFSIDVVHTFLNMGSFFGSLAAKMTGKPVVCSAIRDAKDKSFKEKLLKRFLARLSDVYVANSNAGFKNRFSKMRSNFRVIYNGIDSNRFCENLNATQSIINEFQLSRFEYIVGMVASASMHKDQDTLLDAIPTVLDEIPKVGFVLVGDGERRIYLEKKVDALGIADNVIFTGFRQDVDSFYPLFDISILLTNADVHLEGISNALVESMVVGIPVIASAGGGTDELIAHGVTGIIVAPKSKGEVVEAICHILEDEEFSSRLVKKAKESVIEKFSLDTYVNNYEEVYTCILKR